MSRCILGTCHRTPTKLKMGFSRSAAIGPTVPFGRNTLAITIMEVVIRMATTLMFICAGLRQSPESGSQRQSEPSPHLTSDAARCPHKPRSVEAIYALGRQKGRPLCSLSEISDGSTPARIVWSQPIRGAAGRRLRSPQGSSPCLLSPAYDTWVGAAAYAGMGGLVQQQETDGADRTYPARRGGGELLCID